MLLFAAHQPAICTQSVGNNLFRIGRKFYAAALLKADDCFTKPDTALLKQIIVLKSIEAVVYNNIFVNSIFYYTKIILH